ncbi:GNAT family N-acetyltransferase [Rhodobacterales bacterium HKCCE3408]|nr:GNAT family N-acetyltransferase [Rhodobacterales bacterium HKCCE3408]
MSALAVRPYAGEAAALGRIFHRAVREGAASHYSDDERAAWSPAAPDGADWAGRLSAAETLVAERDGTPVGFIALVDSHYVDFFYVLPEERGRGTAAALYAVIEGRARAAGTEVLTVHASLLAEPFFARQGWSVVAREEVMRNGVALRRAAMEKRLTAAGQAA